MQTGMPTTSQVPPLPPPDQAHQFSEGHIRDIAANVADAKINQYLAGRRTIDEAEYERLKKGEANRIRNYLIVGGVALAAGIAVDRMVVRAQRGPQGNQQQGRDDDNDNGRGR